MKRAAPPCASCCSRVSMRLVRLFTSFESAKAKHLAVNPHAEIAFHWHTTGVQVRIRGSVTKVSDEEADSYFASRDRGVSSERGRRAKRGARQKGISRGGAVGNRQTFRGCFCGAAPILGAATASRRVQSNSGETVRIACTTAGSNERDGRRVAGGASLPLAARANCS